MKVPVLVLCALVGLTALPAEAEQNNPRGSSNSSSSAQAADPVAEAYAQFLMAHRLEDDEDIDGAIAAYKRAMTLDPGAASIVADLANLYMRLNRVTDAINTAEQALKIDAKNRAAHQVLGSIYASQAMSGGRNQRTVQQESLPKAIDHLEQAIANTEVPADANTRALLSRLYIAANNYDKAIPMLAELVKQEPGWQDGAMLLMQAYTAAGRTDEALKWLEESAPENPDLYETLADYYSRQRRFADAAEAYGKAVDADPRNPDLRLRYAGSLINAGTPDTIAKARDVLTESLALRGNDERTMYLLSQAQRQLGDFAEAERTARQLISAFRTSPRGYLALAETLEERQGYSDVVDALAPAVTQFRSVQNGSTALSMLLPHLGFAYQQLGQSDKAIDTFSEALKLSPDDEVLTSYLLQAQLSAKKYTEALALVRAARQQDPDDLRLATIEAQALRQTGKTDEGIAILEGLVAKRGDDPQVYIALAQVYSDASRPAQAIRTLQSGQQRLPAATILTFELGATYDKQKRPAEAEAAFRQVIAAEPDHAAALNYLGYMLAERGERLDESVDLVKRALKIEPDNGAYLDSLGWAYFKGGKLDLALESLQKAATQLTRNSVIQDHYGDVLLKLERYDDAISAWSRALNGDGDSIDRADIDRKIRAARQKLPKR